IQASVAPMMLVTGVTLISYFKFGTRNLFRYKKEILFFAVLGLTGLLPVQHQHGKQAGHDPARRYGTTG
ncbi:MAG: hypothetical protein DRI97_10640, partial [Bacteroidetes bacterium]